MNIQRTPEWHAARVGRVTASRIHEMMARTKTGWGASRDDYLFDLVVERRTGAPVDTYVNAHMQRGIELEPEAVAAYEYYADIETEEVGFIPHPRIEMAGASPDRLVGADGLLEVKCPKASTHGKTLCGASIDRAYILQIQFQMAVTGRAWCDWVSFDPRWPEEDRLYIERVHRDNEMIAELEKQTLVFLKEIDLATQKVINRKRNVLFEQLKASAELVHG